MGLGKKRPIKCQKRPLMYASGEGWCVDSDGLPLERQKRPTTEAKETYYRYKRDLLQRQKRPTTDTKETYYRGKRDLLQRQKRPTTEAKETY